VLIEERAHRISRDFHLTTAIDGVNRWDLDLGQFTKILSGLIVD
jgi:hypothetical protein